MIIEDYVSFETAKLLKEKGFQQLQDNCRYFTTEMIYSINVDDNGEHHFVHQYPAGVYNKDNYIAAPTLQMVMKWLREVHNLHCDIGYDFRVGWKNKITSLKETVIDHDIEMKTYLPYKTVNYPSYEDACEDAIKYCLKELI